LQYKPLFQGQKEGKPGLRSRQRAKQQLLRQQRQQNRSNGLQKSHLMQQRQYQ
jgi:hypothetical protein